jgi:hypothetical protein
MADPISKLKAIWQNDLLDAGQKLSDSRSLLLRNNLAEYRKLPPSKILVHKSNRGGRMLGFHDVHAKGATMLKVGVRLEKISDAEAFELSPDSAIREEHLKKNRQLVEASDGCLAPVTGTETMISVGCSHTTAFCRATMAGCRTPITELDCAGGYLSLDGLLASKPDNQNHPFRSMCADGWEWFCIRSEVEKGYPQLPGLWQAALNASHAVNGAAHELESAAFIADCMKSANDLSQAISAAKQSHPACYEYLPVIGHYVQNYGGGLPDFRIIQYLDVFSKTYSKNVSIGQDFMTSVAYTVFDDQDQTVHTLVRAGLLVTQLTSLKIVDKIAKLLVRSDVDKLRSKEA